MKRNRAETRPPRDGFLWSLTTVVALGTLMLGARYKANVDEAASQPDCVVAVGSGDTIASIDQELRDAGDRHHQLGVVLDTSGEPVTAVDRPRFEPNGDLKVYDYDNTVFYYIGEAACWTVQGMHNAAPIGSDVPLMQFVEPFFWQRELITS